MSQFLHKLSKNIVMIIFTCIIAGLTILSIVGTCFIDSREHMYYTYTNGFTMMGYLFIFSLLFLLFIKFKKVLDARLRLSRLLIFSFVLGILFILVAQFRPRADQLLCMTFAKQMHEGDYSAFMPKAYMQTYPQQTGLVLVYYLLGFLVGTDNVMFIQLLNVIAYTAFIYCIHSLTKRLFKTESLANYAALATICFLPLLFFTSFVYGTMIGLAASTYAILKAMDYMEERRISNCIQLSLFAGLAVLVRKNYIIVIIAILCVLFLHAIIRNHKRAFLCILLLTSSYLCFTRGPLAITEQITGQKIGPGLPSIAWVTMGMQNGNARANGWYTGYSLNTYQDHDCDANATKAIAKKDLKKYLDYFASHPFYAATFFTSKVASEWNEPSFQLFYINDVHSVTEEESPFIYNMTKGVGHPILLTYFDFLLTFTYLGTFLYIIYQRKHAKLWDMIPLIAFIGGFLFHLAWEAKGQYTLSYFVLLFPYCLKGYSSAYHFAIATYKGHDRLGVKRTCLALSPVLILTVVFTIYSCICLTVPGIGNTVTASNECYQTYLASTTAPKHYTNADYRIKDLVTGQYVTFDNSGNDFVIKASLSSERKDTQVLHVETTPKETLVLIKKYEQPLTKVDFKQFETTASKRHINYYCLPGKNKWGIYPMSNGTYVLKNTLNYALTRSKDGNVVLKPFLANDKNQRFHLERA